MQAPFTSKPRNIGFKKVDKDDSFEFSHSHPMNILKGKLLPEIQLGCQPYREKDKRQRVKSENSSNNGDEGGGWVG